ncbi:chromatin associated protein [Mycena galericulata]|nr:chromatin associated protein [Mycena galericulata]
MASTPSNIYQHRSIPGLGPPPHDGAPVYNVRGLSDTLDRVKQEFEVLASELTISRDQRERYESTITAQADELEKIRQALHELEAQHNKVRQQYEYEVRMLRSEARQPPQPQSQSHTRPTSAIATLSSPSIFMSSGGGSVHQSPVLDPHHGSSRDHGRESRERDIQRARFLEQGSNKRIKLDQPELNRLPLIGPGSASSPPPPPSASSRRAPTPLPPPPPPSASHPPPPPPPAAHQAYMNDFLNNLELSSIHPEYKKEGGGGDWFVVYNPRVKRTLDVGLVHTFAHETVVCCIQFSGDGKYLATGCNRTAQIYDVKTGQRICVLADEGSSKTGDLYIRSVRFSPDGRFLATGAEDERVRIWDIDKRTIRAVFEGHHQDIYSLDFSADGRRLVSGSGDASVRVWDLEASLASSSTSGTPPPRILTAHPESSAPDDDAGVMSVAISPDGTLIAAGCVDALVRLWRWSRDEYSPSRGSDEYAGGGGSWKLVEVLRGHQNSVHSVVFTRDGGGVVSGALDNTIRCWDLRGGLGAEKGRKERDRERERERDISCTVFAGHKDYVLSVGISRDSQWIVSGSKDRGVHFWDTAGVVQCMLQGHKNSVISTSLHPVANLLATGSGDKLARIWSYNAL